MGHNTDAREINVVRAGTVVVVGPRPLPPDGQVMVWCDSGSGPNGVEIQVPTRDLKLAEPDDGTGRYALYQLRTRFCEG